MDGPTLRWLHENVYHHEVQGAEVLEVGSQDVNGSVRPHVLRGGPIRYLGVDVAPGKGVDRVLDVGNLVAELGRESWDFVVSTEMLEHVEDWRGAVRQLKAVLRPGGTLVLTTRSPGFPRHGYPGDHWRFTPAILRAVFADFDVLTCRRVAGCGVVIKARKPRHQGWVALGDVEAVAAPRRYLPKRVEAAWFKVIYRLRNPGAAVT